MSGATRNGVIIYTDGAALGNPGPGGYGVMVINNDKVQEYSGGYQMTTNNRMEIMAVIVGLKSLACPSSVTLYSDSQYVVNSITQGWAKKWQANQWKKADKRRAENVDLWRQVLDLLKKHDVSVQWVHGHAGNSMNERCDRLAVQAAKGNNLSPDEGYQPMRQAPASLFDL